MTAGRTKHEALRDALLDTIEQLQVNDPLPPERALAAQYQVSRMTLRRALDVLERSGRVVRRQGAGTFVARPKVNHQLLLRSFTEDMQRLGMTAGGRIVAMNDHTAGARLGAQLRVSPAAGVWTIGRLRLADGEPMALEWLSIPKDLVPGLKPRVLEGQSFYWLLEHEYGVRLIGGRQRMEASVTDEEESRLLQVPLHSPALVVERVTWTEGQRVVEHTRSTYRGDRYTFTADLNTVERPGS